MGKPRMIILVRHAQSEGNKNREVHQIIPDHRVKLTEDGGKQAEEAGHRLRQLLNPDDTLQFYTSPYRRTRETTEGILRTLTSPSGPHSTPSPFSRSSIKVYEEPRLREQDFGNFQPCSAEMERMWQERADYGHFFYRIPNGESAADAYDRVSGFNESLWRSFGEREFPSVCVLVTHGLMTRVFLMKWYHWSVEYFEDLRNVNHCEFVVMKQNQDNGKFILQDQLRTWSELKRQKAEEAAKQGKRLEGVKEDSPRDPQRRNTLSQFLKTQPQPQPPTSTGGVSPGSTNSRPAKWGGCVAGCNHHHEHYPRRNGSKAAGEVVQSTSAAAASEHEHARGPTDVRKDPQVTANGLAESSEQKQLPTHFPIRSRPDFYRLGRDAGGSESGAATPAEGMSDDEYFSQPKSVPHAKDGVKGRALANALRKNAPRRRATEEDIERWANESGMGNGTRADALGDEPQDEDSGGNDADGSVEGDLEDEGGAQAELEEARGRLARELDDEKREDQSLRGSVY